MTGAADVLRGILLMCAGVSTFPFMNVGVKLLAPHYPAAQITWARFTGHLLVMLIVFLPQYRWGLLRTRRPAVQIGRSLLMLASNLIKRVGQPQDVVGLAVFLAGDDATYITGANIVVDGGFACW